MTEANDLNRRIAKAKGWKWSNKRLSFVKGYNGALSTAPRCNTNWLNPEGKPAIRPDFTGTLEGVSGMLRELQEKQYRKERALPHPPDVRLHWSWRYLPQEKVYRCTLKNQGCGRYILFESPEDRPGDCVGKAYMSVFGKEEANDRAG